MLTSMKNIIIIFQNPLAMKGLRSKNVLQLKQTYASRTIV